MTSPSSTARPASIDLSALVAPLPVLTLVDGSQHQLCYTAAAAERFKEIRALISAFQKGENVDDLVVTSVVDDCLAHVLPTASPDQLAATFRENHGQKMSVLVAASGRADEALRMLAGKSAAGESSPPSTRDTTSAP
jgi:hypothetical protein